jgi:hypothetical protein
LQGAKPDFSVEDFLPHYDQAQQQVVGGRESLAPESLHRDATRKPAIDPIRYQCMETIFDQQGDRREERGEGKQRRVGVMEGE